MADKSSNPIGSVFPDSSATPPPPIDWAAAGLRTPYVMYISGRCGSTLLTHLLEDSALCGSPHEFFNETAIPTYNAKIGAKSPAEYLAGIVRHYQSGGIFGMQIDHWRLKNTRELIDYEGNFAKAISFWMTRRDLLSQAYSFARAKATGHWHVYDTHSIGAANADYTAADNLLWKEVHLLAMQEKSMKDYFNAHSISPIPLYYEDLITDNVMITAKVMHAVGCEKDKVLAYLPQIKAKTVRLDAGKKYQDLVAFRYRHGDLLSRIETRRDSLTQDDLNEMQKRSR